MSPQPWNFAWIWFRLARNTIHIQYIQYDQYGGEIPINDEIPTKSDQSTSFVRKFLMYVFHCIFHG